MTRQCTSFLKFSFSAILICNCFYAAFSQTGRTITELKTGWFFIKKDLPEAANYALKEKDWQTVTVPHDWAIAGPFSKDNDLQTVQVKEDGEQKATTHSGRTGALPFAGVGWYRKHITIQSTTNKSRFYLEFDGAMSNAKVYVNGKFVGEWPYGYSSFCFDITAFVKNAQDNVIAVRLENFNESSRWYPGAGIYRNVRLVQTNNNSIAHWGTFVSTPSVNNKEALVKIETAIEASAAELNQLSLTTIVYNNKNEEVAQQSTAHLQNNKQIQSVTVANPILWSANHPTLYHAVSQLKKGIRL